MVDIKHDSTAPLGGGAKVSSAEWNRSHTVTVAASPRVLGRTTGGAGPAEELSAGTGISLTGLQIVNTAPHIATDLAVTGTGDVRTITSSTGADVTIPVATTTLAGWLSTGDKTKLDNIEALADVTDTANVTAAGALMDSEVDADIKTLTLPANTTISTFGASLVDDADAATARTTLGLAIGTDVQAYRAALTSSPSSDPTGVTGADAVTNILSLTQAEYDAITPNASTLYVIV